MDIEIAESTAVPEVIRIVARCTQTMREKGIDQWDTVYPDLEGIYDDARERSLFIAREGDLCVGSVCLNRIASEQYKSVAWTCVGDNVLVVHRLCVDPEWQRKGIASALMNFAERFARSEGYACIHLDAYSGNARAVDLYERRGYRRRGQVCFPRRTLPFVCFELRIDGKTID